MSRSLLTALTLAPVLAMAQGGTRAVWQPVLEYLVREPDIDPNAPKSVLKINPFVAYTHLGTDFGFHGPGEDHVSWEPHRVCVALEGDTEWAGMWHSLAGLATESDVTLDFQHCYPSFIQPEVQPKIQSVMMRAMGKGQLKLEIKNPAQNLLWTGTAVVDDADAKPVELDFEKADLCAAKFLNWTAEPGSDVCLTTLRFKLAAPQMDFDRYVLLTSYAKLARCYGLGHGLVRDRAHVPCGTFDSVPATGLFALATAIASRPESGLVTLDQARSILQEIETTIAHIPKAHGLLPHFVRRVKGEPVIHPGTEYSTVDTALTYHGLLLAAEVLNDAAMRGRVLEAIRAIEWPVLTLSDGAISHGIKDDGITVIPFAWRDWGGESALVWLLQRLSGGTQQPPPFSQPGKPWQGTGFITELQSLFYPDFDSDVPDAVSKVSWLKVRKDMLTAQKRYFGPNPPAAVAKLGLYGLSAGEGAYGTNYEVSGVDLPGQTLIHPHYILMSATLDEPAAVYSLLHRMEDAGYLTPWGVVENITADGSRYLPMISSLNAGFETLGAYHLLCASRKIEDGIYKANLDSKELRLAVQLFYPKKVEQFGAE